MDAKLHTPEGVKDYLPAEAVFKTEIERSIESVFSKYGFLPVSSPTFEYMEVFDGNGGVSPNQMYKFIDRDGALLTLRADMTPPIARIAATAYEEKDIPLRFYYFERVFRYNEHYQGKLRESNQAGIELIGVNSPDADAEAIAVAVNSLKVCGLKSFKLCIGQVQFFNAVLEEGKFDQKTCEKIRNYIIDKEYTAALKIAKEVNAPENIIIFFKELPMLIGGQEIIEKAKSLVNSEKALNALNDLENIYQILSEYKSQQYISFDLSIIGLSYYTGIIFRGYAEGTGFSIINGGRYDKLVENYGADYPAVGFAIKINNLLAALESQNVKVKSKKPDTLLMYTKEGRATAISSSAELRNQGVKIENSLLGDDIEKNKQYAKQKGMGGILYFINSEDVKIINIEQDTVSDIKISELLKGDAK